MMTRKKKLEYVKDYIKFLEERIKNGSASSYDYARMEAFTWILYEHYRMSGIIETTEEDFHGGGGNDREGN